MKDAYYVCDFPILAANKSPRATTRYIDLFPPAITVKLARYFVFITAMTETCKMFP